jgi:P-type Cu2+ transporter
MQALTTAASAAPETTPWVALDEPAEWKAFSRPVQGREGIWESWLGIQGMHCTACALNVQRAIEAQPGVQQAEVNGASAVARVVWRELSGRPSDWMRALDAAGYSALPAGDMLPASDRRHAQRMMLWRWLVAGFCMMQVMMYAFPAYVAAPADIAPDIQALLRWASWILTLPVVLFSCWPFFTSAWRDVKNGRAGMDVPVALGVLIAFGASTAATFDPTGPMGGEVWYESVTMFAFFLLSARLLEQRLRDRTAGSLESLMRRLPQAVERRKPDGGFEHVASRRIMAGDYIRVLPGQAFAADGVVIEGESKVDEALLTGESRALQRRPGDAVIAGSHNLTGVLLVQAGKVGAGTRYAGIVALMEQASVQKPALAQLADRIAGPFLYAVMLASAASAAWWWDQGPARAVGIAIAVLIVTCPCALSLATPAATLAAAGFLARRGILVRNLQALEAGALVDTVVFDKTGTLTEDRISLSAVHVRDGVTAAQALSFASALAQQSLHPVSQALAGASPLPAHASAVTEVAGEGVQGMVAPHDGGAQSFMRLGSASFCNVMGSASGRLRAHLADEAGWMATFELDEALRADAPQAIASLRSMDVGVELLSGDRRDAVARLAVRAGITSSRGGQSPEDKLARVDMLQRAGRKVLMAGDGMNDAPVLARADISVAVGDAVPLAQAKADFIVPGGQLKAVPLLLRQSRRTRSIVRQNLLWALVYNAVCVPLAAAGFMPPWIAGLGMAASSLLVVMNSARLARAPSED